MIELGPFEEWAIKNGLPLDRYMDQSRQWRYISDLTRGAFMAWQAACPEGYSVVPTKITAESGHKYALIGEFSESVTMPCPECFDFETADNDCECCNGEGEYQQPVPIEWSTIKRIHDVVVQVSAAPKPGEL